MDIDANVMADFTERSIKVYSAEQSAWSEHTPSNQTNGHRPIHLFYHDNSHFDSLVPLESAEPSLPTFSFATGVKGPGRPKRGRRQGRGGGVIKTPRPQRQPACAICAKKVLKKDSTRCLLCYKIKHAGCICSCC